MLHTALLMLCIGIFAGVMGAILGIGGGMIITPIVTLALGMDIKYAIGASIIAVIATSSGSTIAFLRDDVLNLRVAMFLEIFTTIGAIIGALLTGAFNPMILYVLFGALLVFSSWNMYRKLRRGQEVLKRVDPDKLAENSSSTVLIMTKTSTNKSIIRSKTFRAAPPSCLAQALPQECSESVQVLSRSWQWTEP